MLKFLSLALEYSPLVLQGVVAVEQTLAGAPGATKEAAVMAAVQAAAGIGESAPDDHVKVISSLIKSLVGTLNQTGWFKKGVTPKVV